MRITCIALALASFSFAACKARQTAAAPVAATATTMEQTSPSTTGKVSHQYKATGCATVIIVKNGDEIITLIPSEKLPEQMDVDGLEISFDYRPLRMHNPEGCNAGFPAQLTNLKIAKK